MRHHVDRVRGDDEHGLGRVVEDGRHDLAEDGRVACQQLEPRLARALVDPGGQDHDARAGEVGIVAGHHLERMGERDRVQQVVGLRARPLLVLVDEHDPPPHAAHHERVRRRRAHETRADDADLHPSSLAGRGSPLASGAGPAKIVA